MSPRIRPRIEQRALLVGLLVIVLGIASACTWPAETETPPSGGGGGIEVQYCEDDGRGGLQTDRCTQDPGRYGDGGYVDPSGGPERQPYDGTP